MLGGTAIVNNLGVSIWVILGQVGLILIELRGSRYMHPKFSGFRQPHGTTVPASVCINLTIF